jgi:hypothetical protein
MKKYYRLFFLLWIQSIVLLTCFLTACNNDSNNRSFSVTSVNPSVNPSAPPIHHPSTGQRVFPAPPPRVDINRLAIEPNALSLYPGQEKHLNVFILKGSTKTQVNDKVQWSVDDPAIAEVDTSVITAKAVGPTKIRANFDNKDAYINLIVNKNNLESIAIEPANTEAYANEKIHFKARGFYSDQSNKDISTTVDWSVGNEGIAKINSKGWLTTLSPGNTTITAKSSSFKDVTETQITVKGGTLTDLKMSSNDIDVIVGLKKQLVVIGTYSDGTNKEITNDCDWTSDKPNFATVDDNDNKGLVRGVAVGETTVTARLSGKSVSSTITVNAPKITKIKVEPDALLLAKGYSHQLQAFASFDNNTTTNITNSVTWKSADTSLATIHSSGDVLALKQGDTLITATFEKQSGQSKIKIAAPILKSMTISPFPRVPELIVNMPQQFIAIGIFSDGEELNLTNNVTWKSNDANIASIEAGGIHAGLVTPHTTGNITITAADPKTNTMAQISVPVESPQLNHIDLKPDNPDIPVGTHVQMSATGLFSDGKKVDITTDCVWSTASGKIAEVSKHGLVTGIRKDSTTISASFMKQTASKNLTVSAKKLKTLEISPQHPTMESVTSLWFEATAIYDDGSQQNVTKAGWWHSSNPFIALIGTLWPVWGRTWAIIPGECDISFEYQGMTVSTPLSVHY